MYSDRFGITKVRESDQDNLTLSIDIDEKPTAVMLYIPDINDHEHFHIHLNKDQAKIMRDWLSAFIEDDVHKKYEGD